MRKRLHWILVVCVGMVMSADSRLPQSTAGPVSGAKQNPQTSSASRAMTVDDVLKMVEVKLGEDLIIAQVRKNGKPFTLSPDDLVRLKTGGVSDAVIRVMLDPQAPPQPAAALKTVDTEQAGKDRPAADTAKDTFQRAITGPLAGKLRLSAFQKTDGLPGLVEGVQVYELDFTATVEVLENMRYQTSAKEIKTAPPNATPKEQSGFSWDNFYSSAVAGFSSAFMGDKFKVVGKVGYQRKESGWVVAAIEFNSSLDTSGRAAGHGPKPSGTASPVEAAKPATPLTGAAATIAELTASDNDSNVFPTLTREIPKAFDDTWASILQTLKDQKEELGKADTTTGVITAGPSRHSFLGVANFDKYVLLVERIGDRQTRVTLKLLSWFEKSGSRKPDVPSFIDKKARKFLDKVSGPMKQ